MQKRVSIHLSSGPQNYHLIAYKIGEKVDSISINSSIVETNGNIDIGSIKSFLSNELKLNDVWDLQILSVSKLGAQHL